MSDRKPRIGITTGSAKSWLTTGSADYRRAVREAGGVPVLIGRDNVALVDTCDGLLFSGGKDIHPSLYVRRPQDRELSDDQIVVRFELQVDADRDAYELPLARRALAEGIPVLGICRGLQLINVAAGGGLVPDIALGLAASRKHRFKRNEGPARHPFGYRKDSAFGVLIGPRAEVTNTYHHQGVTDAELGPAMVASAYTDDGVVEAMELPSHPFCLAVQFHPERRRDDEIRQQFTGLFRAFVSAARGA